MEPAYKAINSLAEVHEFLSKKDTQKEHLLFILDMDLTLTMPQLPGLFYLTIPEWRSKLHNILAHLNDAEKRKVLTLALQVSEQQLIESEAPAIIRYLQDQDIKTIVLTASLTGQLNAKAPMELQRFQKLRDLGIVLEGIQPYDKILFDNLPSYNSNYPIYYKGILCANGEPGTNMKGPVLTSFLQHINFKPRHIVMVDDKKEHLAYVRHSISEWDTSIQFTGFEYLGVCKHIPQYIDEAECIAYWNKLANRVSQAS